MSDWLEHEAKAECLDLRLLRDQQQHEINMLRKRHCGWKEGDGPCRLGESGPCEFCTMHLDLTQQRARRREIDDESYGFAEQLEQWHRTFFGPQVDPEVARRMVEDRAKAEAKMDALGITPQDIAETNVEDVR